MRLGIKRPVWTAVGAALASLVLVAGCNGNASSPSPSESSEAAADYTVIATTSVFADLAQLALGDNVTIETIIPAGVDVHTFEPSPADAQKLAGADLIVMNGLGLDEWALSLLEAAGKSEEDVLELAEGIDESNAWVYLEGEEHSEEVGDEHAHGGIDPHIWL
ncbi:MAG: metal ABC transporter substrate-binding protein, partial [Candidatus Limnocylindrus sp.]